MNCNHFCSRLKNGFVRTVSVFLLLGLLGGCRGTAPTVQNTEAPTDTEQSVHAVTEESVTQTQNQDTDREETLEELMQNYPSAIQKAEVQATVLYRISNPSDYGERVVLATLQGICANRSEEQILINTSTVDELERILTKTYHVKLKEEIDGADTSVWGLVSHFASIVDGYILCGDGKDDESVSVAVSLCHQLNAIAVPEGNEAEAKAAGLSCVLDVRGCDDAWLRGSTYWDKLSRKTAFEQPSSMAPKLMDLAVMTGGYFSFYDGRKKTEHTEKFSYLDTNAVVFGYNNTLGEYDTVSSFSELEVSLIPADHAVNLSTYSGFLKSTVTQTHSENTEPVPENVHTVTILLSDGDNLQWVSGDFVTSYKWFGSEIRGEFPMGWGLPTTLIDIAPPLLDYFLGEMTRSDEFITELSELGYTFPSKWSSEARETLAKSVGEYMKRSDMHYLEILDDNGFRAEVFDAFTAQDAIDGIFYIDYSNYAGKHGEILTSNGKPVVSARYRLWEGLADGGIDTIAEQINRASTDSSSADAYSFIIVHAWSGLDGDKLTSHGDTMLAVQKLVESFGDTVALVTPSEFMRRVATLVK